MRSRRLIGAGAFCALAGLGLFAVGPVAVAAPAAVSGASSSPGDTSATGGLGDGTASGRAAYPGDPETEAALVADEDRRLVEVHTVGALARWSGVHASSPYRLATGSNYTLILTPRRDAYTLKDLLALAPQTFVRQPDGAFLLSENIVLTAGASLTIAAPQALTVRLASDRKGFVSIVNQGGRLQIAGTAGAPVTITSWDRTQGGADHITADGRAYLRSIGGQVQLAHVNLQQLGFWSGRTGGLALTGSDRPSTGALDAMGRSLNLVNKANKAAAAAGPQAGTPAPNPTASPSPAPDGSPQPHGKTARDAAKATRAAAGPSTGRPAGSGVLSQVLPAGKLPLPQVNLLDPQYSYVSASLTDVSATGNAYGVFVANANGIQITGSRFADSLVDGLVFHRFVSNAVVDKTSSTDNAGDGIVLSRATTGIVLTQVVASHNVRNGVSISGLPLANGPSATGTPVGAYGNNAVENSTMSDNGHYGVEVIGGSNIRVHGNNLDGNDMAVVVRSGAARASVVGNRIRDPHRQGVALRDGLTGATVSGNLVSGAPIGIYVRNSAGAVTHNTITDATEHGISVVGAANALTVDSNTLAGRGPSALDGQRAVDLNRATTNNTTGWVDTTPWPVLLKRFLQPLTVMWLLLALVVLVTALRGVRGHRWVGHPYNDKAPVTGPGSVIDPATLGLPLPRPLRSHPAGG